MAQEYGNEPVDQGHWDEQDDQMYWNAPEDNERFPNRLDREVNGWIGLDDEDLEGEGMREGEAMRRDRWNPNRCGLPGFPPLPEYGSRNAPPAELRRNEMDIVDGQEDGPEPINILRPVRREPRNVVRTIIELRLGREMRLIGIDSRSLD